VYGITPAFRVEYKKRRKEIAVNGKI